MRRWLRPERSPLVPTLVALVVVFGTVGVVAAGFLGARAVVLHGVGADLADELGLQPVQEGWFAGRLDGVPVAMAAVHVRNPRRGVGDRMPDVAALRVAVPVERALGVRMFARGDGPDDAPFREAEGVDRLDASQLGEVARVAAAHGRLRVLDRAAVGDLVPPGVLSDAGSLLIHERLGLDPTAADVRSVVGDLGVLARALEEPGGPR